MVTCRMGLSTIYKQNTADRAEIVALSVERELRLARDWPKTRAL